MLVSCPRILLLEDSALDAELATAQLESGLNAIVHRVVGHDDFSAALEQDGLPDLILSDFDLPGFDGFEALRLARQKCPQVPFVFLSGKLGEEHAVDALRQGATDYVTKQRIERLIPVVRRALTEAWERRERERTELALAEALRRSEAALFAGEVGTYEWDIRADRIRGDRNFLRIFGADSSNPMGIADGLAMLHPDDRDRVKASIEAELRQGDRLEIEFRIVTTEQERWVVSRAHIDRDSDARPIRMAGVVVDITERKLAEERFREESHTVEAINQVGRSMAAELDLEKLVQSVTDATTELTGAQFGAFFHNLINDKDEAYLLYTLSGVDRSHFDKFPMPRNTAVFGPTFRGERIVRLEDVTADARYGQNRPYHGMPPGHLPVRSYLAVPVISRSGEVLGGLFFGHSTPGVFTERHERIVAGIAAQAAVAIDNARLFEAARRANAEKDKLLESERAARLEVERASRMKDEFLSTLSHELRTPLNAILGWSQMLTRMQSPTLEDAQEGLRVIQRNARTQAQLIDDLLDMSRIISGKVRLDVQRVDLTEVIDAAYETVCPAAEAKGVRIRKVLDTRAGAVTGDPNRLQQVVWNLLNNAVKFTPRGGKVDILLERVNSHIELSIHDTGEGISPEFLPYVFDRFRQADAATTRRHSGLGLGLSIVKHIVELHGGAVRARSPGIGKGASFVVDLPVSPIHAEAHPKHLPAHGMQHKHLAAHPGSLDDQQPRLDGVKVLLVDDEPDARDLMRRMLGEYGAEVLVAADAKSGLELVRCSRPAVIVSDVGMPEHDGYDFIRWVRALSSEQGGRTPAVALTAFARSDDRRRAIAAGYQMHLAKPAEPEELVTVVGSLAGLLPHKDVVPRK